MKRMYVLFNFLLLLFVMYSQMQGQEKHNSEAQKIFSRFEEGMTTGAVDKFSKYFSYRTYLSFTQGVNGYYSFDQSYYVVKDFLSINLPVSFSLTNVITDTSSPFAFGTLKYIKNGIRGSASVFISIQFTNKKWQISQVTIN